MDLVKVRVVRVVQEADDIRSFELASANGEPLPAFSAGSHIDVKVSDSIIRQYSLCNDPDIPSHYRIGVLKDPNSRGGSVALHESVAEGCILDISRPKNHFSLVSSDQTLLFAGGIGITPLLSMATRLSRIGADFEMHYAAKSVARMAFVKEIMASTFSSRVHFYYDDGDSINKISPDLIFGRFRSDAQVYVCGPKGFIDYICQSASDFGFNKSNIHFEYFAAAPKLTRSEGEFKVQIASTGLVYEIPAEKSILQVLSENGVAIPYSCEQGVCGTCATRVLKGLPDHRDLFFSTAEQEKNDIFTPCCSRSRSDLLVLDI